jgi:hypothetical protein
MSCLVAQTTNLRLQDISITGNEHTKDYIVLRELNLVVGDTLFVADTSALLSQNRNQLLNTGLFADADLWLVSDSITLTTRLHIQLTENLFILPYAWVDFIDNDFNVWWNVQGGALDRTLPYLGFKHFNLTGQRDELSAYFQVGFTNGVSLDNTFIRKIRVAYTSPYLDKAQSLQLTSDFLYGRDRTVRLNTFNNRDTFITNEQQPLLQRTLASVGLNYRPQLFESHVLELSFQERQVDEVIVRANEDYFGRSDQNQQRFLSLSYRFTSDRRDFQLLAKKGYYFEGGVIKEGFGLWGERNAFILDAEYANYFSLSPKWSLEAVCSVRTNLLRSDVDYYNLPVVGPKPEAVRGYITYHLRGSDFVYLKSSFRYELWDKRLNFRFLPAFIGQYRSLPLAIYFKLNNDAVYVHAVHPEPTNSLNDELLYGGGVGVDFVVANTMRLELMGNTNSLGDRRFQLHTYFSF